MWKRFVFLFCSLLVLTLWVRPVRSEEPAKEAGFYEDRRHGFYWYEDEKAPKKKKPAQFKKYSDQELWDMPVDDLKKHLETVQKLAVQSPTEQNAVEFLRVKDVVTRKSMAFSAVMMATLQQHPELASDTASPTVTPGRRAQAREMIKEIQQTLFKEKDNFALIMFSRKGCDYCQEQDGILQFFENSYGWEIRNVDIQENPVLAAKFNVRITPTLLVVKKDGTHMIVSVGVVSMDDIEKRLYRSVRLMNGDIDKTQWFTYDYQKSMGGDPNQYNQGQGEQ